MRHSAREAVPFLADIPDGLYHSLDPREWFVPQGDVAVARRELEAAVGGHVMTYRRGTFLQDVPPERHLCGRVAGAVLDDAQAALLHAYEERFRAADVSFVVYAKPLSFIDVEDSPVFRHARGQRCTTSNNA